MQESVRFSSIQQLLTAVSVLILCEHGSHHFMVQADTLTLVMSGYAVECLKSVPNRVWKEDE